MDPQFAHPFADRLHITKLTRRKAFDSHLNAGSGPDVTQTIQPVASHHLLQQSLGRQNVRNRHKSVLRLLVRIALVRPSWYWPHTRTQHRLKVPVFLAGADRCSCRWTVPAAAILQGIP
jgi:hypothetical protein